MNGTSLPLGSRYRLKLASPHVIEAAAPAMYTRTSLPGHLEGGRLSLRPTPHQPHQHMPLCHVLREPWGPHQPPTRSSCPHWTRVCFTPLICAVEMLLTPSNRLMEACKAEACSHLAPGTVPSIPLVQSKCGPWRWSPLPKVMERAVVETEFEPTAVLAATAFGSACSDGRAPVRPPPFPPPLSLLQASHPSKAPGLVPFFIPNSWTSHVHMHAGTMSQ